MSAPTNDPSQTHRGTAAMRAASGAACAAQKRVSIVVACRNESKYIQAFVDSLLAQDLADFDWEIIVADGASDDGTRKILSQFAKRDSRITIISNPSRFVSTGLNAAIRAARGDVILRMDAHTEYAPDYVKRCVATLESSGADNV